MQMPVTGEGAGTAKQDAIREWLIKRVAFYLEVSPAEIKPDVRLTEYGLDSIYALTLCGDIEERYECEVEPTMAWDYPTIGLIAAALIKQLPDLAALRTTERHVDGQL